MYYRYELVFDGEDQHVGILVGLSDTSIPEEQQAELRDHFDAELPIPELFGFGSSRPDIQSVSYFTENGRMIFQESLKKLIAAIEETGIWSVKEMIVPEVPGRILYRDWFQIVCEV